MDQKGLRVIHKAYISLLTHIKQLLSVAFCDTTVEIGARNTETQMDGQTVGFK